MVVFFVLYQQLENHVLQPIVYGRTVQLSPLAVLIAVLIGAELAGVIGALAAIPGRRNAPGAPASTGSSTAELRAAEMRRRRSAGRRSDQPSSEPPIGR